MDLSQDLYKRLAAAKVFIDENYQQQIDLSMVSKYAFLSQFHFHRLFRQVYKITPHQYIRKKRLEKAKSLLSENKSVVDVCTEVGFESPGSFSILFKKEIGFAPQYYRNLAYKKKMEQQAEPKTAIPNCFFSSYFALLGIDNPSENKI